MKKPKISYCLILLMLLQSCVVYQKSSVSLSNAHNEGKVKVISQEGENYWFQKVYLKTAPTTGLSRKKFILSSSS